MTMIATQPITSVHCLETAQDPELQGTHTLVAFSTKPKGQATTQAAPSL